MITGILLIAGIVLIAILAIVAVKLRALDILGAFSGAIISLIALLAGGFSWLLMIIIFVGVSSAMTRYKYEYKRKLGFAQDKMGMRSWPNSLANGGVSFIASVGEIYTHSEFFAIMFLASVTAAMSDTLATEIGLLSRARPRLITHPSRDVEVGTSGGTSPAGNLAAIVTSGLMGLIGIASEVVMSSGFEGQTIIWLGILIGSVGGVFFDSLLGATVQGSYKCAVCGNLTENETHHGNPALLVQGLRHFDNNAVNFLGIFFGSILSIILVWLLSFLVFHGNYSSLVILFL